MTIYAYVWLEKKKKKKKDVDTKATKQYACQTKKEDDVKEVRKKRKYISR
jgi:hypothetical protein